MKGFTMEMSDQEIIDTLKGHLEALMIFGVMTNNLTATHAQRQQIMRILEQEILPQIEGQTAYSVAFRRGVHDFLSHMLAEYRKFSQALKEETRH